MDRHVLKERCIKKLLGRCTSKENAIDLYDDFVRGISESAWHLMNLSIRDEVMTTTILKATKDSITDVVLDNWVEGEYNHFPNNSDIAHAIGAVLVARCYSSTGGTDIYEQASYVENRR